VVIAPVTGRFDPDAVARLSRQLSVTYTGVSGVAAVGRQDRLDIGTRDHRTAGIYR